MTNSEKKKNDLTYDTLIIRKSDEFGNFSIGYEDMLILLIFLVINAYFHVNFLSKSDWIYCDLNMPLYAEFCVDSIDIIFILIGVIVAMICWFFHYNFFVINLYFHINILNEFIMLSCLLLFNFQTSILDQLGKSILLR